MSDLLMNSGSMSTAAATSPAATTTSVRPLANPAVVAPDALSIDPDFRKLNYRAQIIVRQSKVFQQLQADPQFSALSLPARAVVAQKLATDAAKKAPALWAYDQGVTDQDRIAFDSGALNYDPNGAYKAGLIIGERFSAGDTSPALVNKAKGWVTLNRMTTESLLAKVATGAKDAIEVMFGTDDKLFNDLSWHTQDYQRLTSWITQQMPGQTGNEARAGADVAGFVTGLTETALLNVIAVGSLAEPGLFTKRMYAGLKAAGATAVTPAAVAWTRSGAPAIIDAIGSGTVDVLRKIPELIETGQVQGPQKFFTGLASTFGEGVAYDFVFNMARDLYKLAIRPAAKAFKGLDLTNKATLQPFLDATGNFEPEKFSGYLNETLSGRAPGELYDALDADGKESFDRLANFMKTNAEVPNFDVHSEQGFKVMAKAMGFDVDWSPAAVTIAGDLDHPPMVFKDTSEAVSWMVAKGSVGDLNADLAGAAEGRLRTTMKTGLKLADLNDAQLVSVLTPNFTGAVPENNMRQGALEILSRYDAPKPSSVTMVPESEWVVQASKANYDLTGRQLVLPKTLTGVATRDQVLGYLANVAGKGSDTRFAVSAGVQTLSGESLQAAVARIPGASLTQTGDKWLLSYNGRTQSFSELTEVNQLVTKTLVDGGLLTEDQIAKQVAESTGYVLTKDVDPSGVVPQRWVLRDGASGREVAQNDDLTQLLFGRMDFSPKLPETLAPDIEVAADRSLTINKTVASGPVASLRAMMDDYGPAEKFYSPKKPAELVKTYPDGSSIKFDSHTAHYELEVPAVGLRQKFTKTADAEKFLDKLSTDYGTVRQTAERKGYKVVGLPDGTVGFFNGTEMLRARTVAEAQQVLRASPDSAAHENLFPFLDQDVEDSIRARTQAVMADTTMDQFNHAEGAISLSESTIKANVDTMLRPALSSFDELSKLYNDPSISAKARQFMLRRRFVSQQTYEASQTIGRMLSPSGKMLSKSDMELAGQLLQYKPELWDNAAKVLMANDSYVLGDGIRQSLTLSRQYLNHMGQYFGIDPLRFMEQYTPHIRQVLAQNGGLAKMLSSQSREQVMEQVFGKAWAQIPEVKFLSQNARLDAFLDAHNQTNLLNTLMWYTEHGLREKFLGSYLQDMKGYMSKMIADQANPVLLGRIAGFYSAASGGESDFMGSVITDSSVRASKAIAGNLNKLSALMPPGSRLAKKFSELADQSVTTNYLDKASSAVSYATLGWRPFRTVSNLAQIMNTYSVYGKYVEDAIAYVDKYGDDYTKTLFARGILNERIFAATPEGYRSTVGTLLDKSMSWNQNAEYLTRAWTAKAVDLAFTDSQEKLATGLLGTGDKAVSKFMRLANLDVLDDTDQTEIVRLLKLGKPEAAKDLAQTSAVRTFMFDYSKENYPMTFKGTMGKAFGKFGVYPVGQVDLYRRILSTSDYGTRIVRGLRLMGSSLAVYEGFRQVGIDYSGFLLTDPFSFSGGPLYQSFQDLLKVNDSGTEGALARSNLSRNFLPLAGSNLGNLKPNIPRLLIPGALQAQSLIKATTSFGQGQYFEGLLDATSAPRDTSYIGAGHWYFD